MPVSTLGEELGADMEAAIESYEQTFTWRGSDFPCVLSSAASSLIVAKSLFTDADYPARGEGIIVAGVTRQVTKLNNSGLDFAPGGFVETIPFVDDPSDPALRIEFGKVISQ